MAVKIQDLFLAAIEIGIANDPRGKKEIARILRERTESFKKLSAKRKKSFDQEDLRHPFGDTRIFFGEQKKIKTLAVGVDCETPELLLAKHLKIDGVMGHHPEGSSLLGLPNVMDLQESVFETLGVPINMAEKILAPRIAEVSRGVHAANAFRACRAAELLQLPFFNVHTPADNCAWSFMERNICSKKFRTLGELLERICEIEEFAMAARMGNKPKIFCGSEKSKVGKVAATGFTGGTGGSEKIYERLAHAGVGTVLEMHMSELHKKEAEKHHLNVVICSHMASDSLGINQICDHFENELGAEIVPLSGFLRVKRS